MFNVSDKVDIVFDLESDLQHSSIVSIQSTQFDWCSVFPHVSEEQWIAASCKIKGIPDHLQPSALN